MAAAAFSTGLAPPEAVAGNSLTYMLGDTQVTLNVYRSGIGKTTYFAPHSNETYGFEAAKAAVRAHGGRFFWLTHGGKRNITFVLSGKKYIVDPNRVFSDKGAKASLKALGNYSAAAQAAVRDFAEFVAKELFSSRGPIVGIHNNTDGNLSAQSYKNGDNKAEAKVVYINPKLDLDDFFFVTKQRIFDLLKKKDFNVVLQNPSVADDGSLSVRCQRNGLPYVNIEAQVGHSAVQKKMIEALVAL